jgi:hypothetical protein
MPIKSPRPLAVIAKEIRADWDKPFFGAKPYLEAMAEMNLITDKFYLDSGKWVVRYFLANAATWRGDTARRVKAELKGMLGS